MSPSTKKVKRENNLGELSELLQNVLGDHFDSFKSKFTKYHLNLNGKYQAMIENKENEIKGRVYLIYPAHCIH